MTNEAYKKLIKTAVPPSPKGKNVVKAFVIGGLICTLGQALKEAYQLWGASEETAGMLTSLSLIVLTAVLTGFGVFDKIARHAGAGTIVPITGFANAVVSPAMEFKSEGHVLGTAAQMFSIAGPVIVYGTAAAGLYGLIHYLLIRIGG